MRGTLPGEFRVGDRVLFQYQQRAALRGTIEGWADKYNAYMLRCDTGRKLLVPSAYLRREPAEDPVIRQAREKDWPAYAVCLVTPGGTQQIWSGKARTPRLAFLRASTILSQLQDVVRCKTYKRLHIRRKYPLGAPGEQAYCEKVDTDQATEQATSPEAFVRAAEVSPRPDRVRRNRAKSAAARHRAA